MPEMNEMEIKHNRLEWVKWWLDQTIRADRDGTRRDVTDDLSPENENSHHLTEFTSINRHQGEILEAGNDDSIQWAQTW